MNKQLIAAPLLLSLAGIAAAQSSVTLYGIVDAGVTYRSNERVGSAGAYTGHSSVGLTTGNLSGSRWGIKGSEDLGGGMRALFVLENGFDISNGTSGQGGRQFGRQAFVGLGSNRYGTITLGRQYTSLDDFVSPVGPSSFIGGFGAHPGDIDDLDQTARVDSAIKYTSANYSGFTFGALYGFGGQPGSMKQRNTWSVGAAYAAGPLRVGVGYERSDNSKTGATYDFGPAVVGVNYSNVQYRSGAQSLFSGHATFNVAGVFTRWNVQPQTQLFAGYSYTRGSDVDGIDNRAQYHNVTLGAVYDLSKRTSVYLLGAYQHASGTTLDALGRPVAATASVSDKANGHSSDSRSQAIVSLGLRQKF